MQIPSNSIKPVEGAAGGLDSGGPVSGGPETGGRGVPPVVVLRAVVGVTLLAGVLATTAATIVWPLLRTSATAAVLEAPGWLVTLAALGAWGAGTRLWWLVTGEVIALVRRRGKRAAGWAGSSRAHHPLARRLAALLIGAGAAGLLAPTVAMAHQPTGAATTATTATIGRGLGDVMHPTEQAETAAGPARAVAQWRPTAAGRSTGGKAPATLSAPSSTLGATPGSADADAAEGTRVAGWRPGAPVVRPLPDPAFRPTRATEHADGEAAQVVVRRGDTLWAIAARHLPTGATDEEIAAAWPRWYAVNRELIGPDADLLLPGQVLSAPGAGS